MLRLVHTWFAAIAFTIAAFVVPPAALAQIAGGVGYRVAQEPGSQFEGGYLTLTVNAGQTGGGYFFMTNTAKSTAQMRIYSADGLTGNTTGVVYGSAGDPLVEAGSWLTPNVRSAVLSGTSERRIDFSVRVPPGAAAGDHVGSIVLEQNGRGSATVSQIVRNVVPIRIVVPGAPGPQIVVRSAKIARLPGTALPAVFVGLRNTGPRLCAPLLAVSLRGPSEKAREVSRQLDTILPGDRVPYPLPWPRPIEPGSYVARVTSSGCGTTESITVEVEAPDLSVNAAGAGGGATPGPAVVTDAQPGDSIYRAGDGSPSGSGKGTGKGKGKGKTTKGKSDLSGVSGDQTAGSLTPGIANGSGGSDDQNGAGVAGAKGGGGGGVSGALSSAADAVAKAAPDVIKRATIPLALLALIGLVFFVQEAIDRRDPKLALAPLHREPHLPFEPFPLTPRPRAVPTAAAAIPSSTVLRTDP